MATTVRGDKVATMILTNGQIATLDERDRTVSAVALGNGRVLAAGTDQEALAYRTGSSEVIDLGRRTAIPGLNDSHLHVIRGGLTYNMELRWDGVSSLADALKMLREQAQRTPPPQWVRVVGGWNEFQFAERRMPTLEELNREAPDTPVFVLHLYDRALLNRAAVRAVGYTKDTPDPVGAEIQRDKTGQPTGLIIAKPNAGLLYATLGKGPKLSRDDQVNSTRHFMRELNRLGLTSAIDAGGGSQSYPDDYDVMAELHQRGELTMRLAYNLFTQHPKAELADFTKWVKGAALGGDDFYSLNGAGEMLVYSAADFEDFRQERPDMPTSMEGDLRAVTTVLAKNQWPFRLHATYDETITRALTVFEQVDREAPLDGLHWFIDHAETISDRNIERIRALGGGIAIQHRMAYQGEYFVERYGEAAARRSPPIRKMLELGVPVGAGTDATRVASYNPFVTLYWLTTGRTIAGMQLYDEANRLSRSEALRLYTVGSTWFSREQGRKGAIVPGQFADLAVLSGDYFRVPDEEIKKLESVLTITGGKIVHAAGDFSRHAPPLPPASPDWSPVRQYGGFARTDALPAASAVISTEPRPLRHPTPSRPAWNLGCGCFAF